MSTIRTSKEIGGRVLYCAKDIFAKLGVKYRGAESLRGLDAGWATTAFRTVVGTKTAMLSQYALEYAAIQELCKRFGKEEKIFGFKPTVDAASQKQLDKLNGTVSDLKTVIAGMLAPITGSVIKLKAKGSSATIIKNDPLQIEARKQIRELVQSYAAKRAEQLGITGESRSILFDLTYTALYGAYKKHTSNKIDLKKRADERSEASGKKVTGLVMAQELGVAIELLQFAKAFYKN